MAKKNAAGGGNSGKKTKADKASKVTPINAATASEVEADDAAIRTDLIIQEVDPDLIIIDPRLSIRTKNGRTKHEIEFPRLKRMIDDEGQKSPGLGYMSDDGMVLVYGERRLQAVKELRAEGQPDLLYKIQIDPAITGIQAARRTMLAENIHREGFTDPELARQVPVVREECEWEGEEHTNEVADFFGVDPATITQWERFNALPKEVQDKVEFDGMKMTAALDFVHVAPEKQTEVLADAQELANKEAEEKAAKGKKRKGNPTPKVPVYKPGKETSRKHTDAPDETTDADTPPANAPIKQAHVRQAAAEKGALTKNIAPKTGEIQAFALAQSGPANPKVLADAWEAFGEWTRGKLALNKLKAVWDDVADAIPSGAAGGKKAVTKTATTKPAKPTKPATKKAAAGKPAKKVATTAKKAAAKPAAKPAKKKSPASKKNK